MIRVHTRSITRAQALLVVQMKLEAMIKRWLVSIESSKSSRRIIAKTKVGVAAKRKKSVRACGAHHRIKKGGRMVSWRWKLSPKEQIVNQLRATNLQLRRQLTTKTNLANGPAGSTEGLRDGYESCPLRTCPKAIRQ